MQRAIGIGEACGLVILLSVVALCAFHPLYAVDFFWHVALGERIADAHAIPDTNLFSAADPTRSYVQFNWLWELGAAEVVRTLGLRGVRAMQAVLIAVSFASLYWLARSRTPHDRTELAFVVTALGFVWFEDRFQERPASLVLLFTVALIALVFRWQSAHRVRACLALAGLGVLWSNLHGGESLLLPLTFFAMAVGELANRFVFRKADARVGSALLGLGVGTASLFASPTFVRGWISWSQAIGAQVEAGNEEWQPAYTMLAQGFRPAFVIIGLGPTVVAVGWGVEQWRRYRDGGKSALDGVELCLCAGLLVLAHQAVRNVFLCVGPVLFLIREARTRTRTRTSTRTRTAIAFATVVLVGIAAEDSLVYSYAGGPGLAQVLRFDLAPETFPELATEFAREAKLEGGAVNDGRWGGYLIWRLWPGLHLFADSRHHFTPEMWQVFRATHDALARPAGLEHSFRRYGTELTIFRGPTFPIGAPPQFRLLFKAGDQEIYQDLRGLHARENLERTRRWLADRGVAVGGDPMGPDIPELARKFGAQRYLASAYPQLMAAKARRDLASESAAVRGEAHRILASQLYRAGDHRAAAQEFTRALQERPTDPELRYLAAQNTFASGDLAAAQPQLLALLQGPTTLSPRQVRRVRAMLEAARQRASSAAALHTL